MRKDGFEAGFLNLISESDEEYFKYVFGEALGNPKGLPEVYNCFLQGNNYKPQPGLADLIDSLSPDLMVGVGWIAALLMKKAAPQKSLIYLTTGCDQLKTLLVRKRVADFLSFSEYTRKAKPHLGIFSPLEYQAVVNSDYVITHSTIILDLYRYFFRLFTGKIYPEVIWFADWICQEAREYRHLSKPFLEREIDLILVSSDWNRVEKNYDLVKKILSRFSRLNIHIVGEMEETFSHATHHGLITEREKLFQLLGNAKTIICPSLFDAAPGILFEAAVMGCNMITSKNCGNWMICHDELLVDPFRPVHFFQKIPLALEKKFDDNLDYFLKADSYRNLMETISVF